MKNLGLYRGKLFTNHVKFIPIRGGLFREVSLIMTSKATCTLMPWHLQHLDDKYKLNFSYNFI